MEFITTATAEESDAILKQFALYERCEKPTTLGLGCSFEQSDVTDKRVLKSLGNIISR